MHIKTSENDARAAIASRMLTETSHVTGKIVFINVIYKRFQQQSV